MFGTEARLAIIANRDPPEVPNEEPLLQELRGMLGPFADQRRLLHHIRAARGKLHWAVNSYFREVLSTAPVGQEDFRPVPVPLPTTAANNHPAASTSNDRSAASTSNDRPAALTSMPPPPSCSTPSSLQPPKRERDVCSTQAAELEAIPDRSALVGGCWVSTPAVAAPHAGPGENGSDLAPSVLPVHRIAEGASCSSACPVAPAGAAEQGLDAALPLSVLEEVCGHLEAHELCTVAQVSAAFRAAAKSSVLWQRLFLRRWGDVVFPTDPHLAAGAPQIRFEQQQQQRQQLQQLLQQQQQQQQQSQQPSPPLLLHPAVSQQQQHAQRPPVQQSQESMPLQGHSRQLCEPGGGAASCSSPAAASDFCNNGGAMTFSPPAAVAAASCSTSSTSTHSERRASPMSRDAAAGSSSGGGGDAGMADAMTSAADRNGSRRPPTSDVITTSVCPVTAANADLGPSAAVATVAAAAGATDSNERTLQPCSCPAGCCSCRAGCPSAGGTAGLVPPTPSVPSSARCDAMNIVVQRGGGAASESGECPSSTSVAATADAVASAAATAGQAGVAAASAAIDWRSRYRQQSGFAQAMRCPRCGTGSVVPIVYGFPSPPLLEGMRLRRLILGGDHLIEPCHVWACTRCNSSFRFFPFEQVRLWHDDALRPTPARPAAHAHFPAYTYEL